ANVNSEGYVRERTEITQRLTGGVDFGFTDRIMDQFALDQLRRDTSAVGEHQAFVDRIDGLDNALASEANSIGSAMSRFFDSIQTATDDPTSMPSRDAVIGQAENMLNRINQLAEFMKIKEVEVEQQIEASVQEANSLIRQIGDLNDAITTVKGNSAVDEPTKLLNERDQAILKLSEILDIQVRQSSNIDNGLVVNLKSGESLVLANGSFNLFTIGGEPDFNNRQLQLSTNFNSPTKGESTLNILEQDLGGAMGGLFSYREQALEPAQRDLGKLATVLADSVNIQNRQGMDLDQQLGGNLFAIPEFSGINYPSNADLSSSVSGRLIAGESSLLTSDDYQITVLTAPAGVTPATFDVEVAAFTNDGVPQVDESGNPISQVLTVTAAPGVYNPTIGGIELAFSSGANYSVGDEFLVQPTRRLAENLALATTRAEDLAFAKPIRVDANVNNLGDAELIETKVDAVNLPNSGFDGNGGLQTVATSPSPAFGAPVAIRFDSADDFSVLDSAGSVITSVTNAPDLNNLIEQARNAGVPAWPAEFAALGDYPGYDFSLQGIPEVGDEYSISYNEGGINDNRNAIELAQLQQQGLVRQSSGSFGNLVSFNEAFATIVSDIGSKSANARFDLDAASIMKTQSGEWFESSAGVNLDEEAANMIQYQQSYAAAARILSTAQELFNTILQAAR
ncbi:MAG: flagellar basal body rod C-terminal domain-containing protein, partial [Pseudomonadota bacterium]